MPGSLRDVLTGPQDAAGPSPAQVATLHRDLLSWYSEKRRDLPWRRTRDPWAIWVSEIMLQQTRVDTVVPYYERFLAKFPTPLALAEAPEDAVLSAWSGLGYYRRARLLHAGARAAVAGIPTTRDGLLALPGIGRYTAGAIASIAYGESVGLVDGNVARVFARLFAIDADMKRTGMRIAVELSEELVAREAPGDWNQALMELGATVCTPRDPSCAVCPVASSCRALAEGRVGELPVLGAKPKPKPKRVQALVARLPSGKVLLARRRSEGLFGGLWEPPSIDGGVSAKRDLLARIPTTDVARHGRVTHVLSHLRLSVDVHGGTLVGTAKLDLPEVYETADVFDPAELDRLGIATLARKILATVISSKTE